MLKKKDDAYLMAFAAYDGGLYDFYLCDDLNSSYDPLWFKCTQPHSKYIFVWRRDKKSISSEESEKLRMYLEWVIDEEFDEPFEEYGEQTFEELEDPVFMKSLDNELCTVLSIRDVELPDDFDDWNKFMDYVRDSLDEEIEHNPESILQHDKELKVFDGSIFKDMGLVPKKDDT